MTRSRGLLVALILLGLSVPPSVDADAILVADTRGISRFYFVGSGDMSDSNVDGIVPAIPFAPFMDTISHDASLGTASSHPSARQDSTVTTNLFSGSGAFSVTVSALDSDELEEGFGYAESNYTIDFTLTEPHSFDLSGLLRAATASSGGSAEVPFVESRMFLTGPSGSIFDFIASGMLSITHAGTLAAGDYHFNVIVQGSATADAALGTTTSSSRGSYDFEFELEPAPVPEPASLSLLGFGVVVILANKIRRGGAKG